MFLRPEQAIETTENLFYQLLAPLTIGVVSGVMSGVIAGFIVAKALESKRRLKADTATEAPPPGMSSGAAKETE